MYVELYRCRHCGKVFRKNNTYYNKSDVECLLRSMAESSNIYYTIHECVELGAFSIAEFLCFLYVDTETKPTEEVKEIKEIDNIVMFKNTNL